MVEARILLEELEQLCQQQKIQLFVDTLTNNCSGMFFDPHNLCYKLYFKNEYWLKAIEECPYMDVYFYKEEYAD